MTPQQWQRVKSVLTEALERKREEQSAFLDRACSAEPWLRAQVENCFPLATGQVFVTQVPGSGGPRAFQFGIRLTC
jgi:hypothetical protein